MKRHPQYIRIAHQIESQIRLGHRRPGDKLESIRQLAKTQGVSVNTIRSAMELLNQTGLVNSEPKKAMVVAATPTQQNFKPFEQFKPDAKLAKPSREWLDTAVKSGNALNMFVNMVVPADNAMFKSFQRHYRQSLLLPPLSAVEISSGNVQLREKIAQLLSQRQLKINESDIQITNGCQNAIEHALRVVCQPGDIVAVPTPAFPGYLALMGLLNLRTIEIPMTPSGPDPKILKRVMESKQLKALIINPICHNPTGISLDDEYKRNIARWASQNKIAVIEDDICAQLSYCESHLRPIASFGNDGWVMLVSSISKIMGDSERIGWCYPGRFKDAYMTQCAVSQIGSSYYRQKALALYLNGSRFESQLRQWRKDTKAAVKEASQLLTHIVGGEIEITAPTGGYSLWIKLPEYIHAKVLRTQANKQQLDFLPGEFFSLEPRFQNYLRLVIVPPLNDKYHQKLTEIANLIAKHLQ